ncbi:MAG: COX15/CtaA family protein [Myxococcota bacterium]|jgi:cytochrome c oxidase assembly protein subunit 15|nr:COX15/CtaA family protein [Myxococcota bacterium]
MPAHRSVDPSIVRWLWLLFATVFSMVLVGGITRLTESGLSMVDWRPVMGVLPPIGEAAWNEAFDAYKTSPQYREVNAWMEVADFKRIFFWEYTHRVLGRTIALIAFIPWLYFQLRGRLEGWLSFRILVAIALGGGQGLLGWYMVQSGLIDRPEVSHFRLASHLSLAFVIAGWNLWMLMDLRFGRVLPGVRGLQFYPALLMLMLAVQILYGAFMAGTHAGILFPSFPDMNGHYLPGGLIPEGPLLHTLINDPVAIHYIHRALGFALMAWGGVAWWKLRAASRGASTLVCDQLLAVLSIQFVLGALTALWQTPLTLAVIHQGGAFVTACSTLLLAHHAARLERAH